MSLSARVRAANRASLAMSTRYLIVVTRARTSFDCVLSRYVRPGIISALVIQSSRASNWSDTSGGEATAAITSPRLTST